MLEKIQNIILSNMLKMLLKVNPPKSPILFEGLNSTEELSLLMSQSKHKHILILTTQGMINRNLLDDLTNELSKQGIQFSFFADVAPNPTLMVAQQAIAAFHANNCDAILAFGGGSVIDTAKAAALQIGNNVPLEKLVGNFKARKKPIPLYAIPTTAGTGSETTSASVLIDEATHLKVFIYDHKIIAKAVALDPRPILGLPPHISAETGLDALTHAVEAYISNVHHAKMMDNAASAVRLIFNHLQVSIKDGTNIEARTKMSQASYLAGQAFNHMGLGFVHALSHQLTAWYNIPHGKANAAVLPHVLRTSFEKIHVKLSLLAKESGVVTGHYDDKKRAEIFIEKIEGLLTEVNIPKTLKEIDRKDLPKIIKSAKIEARKNHPVPYILSYSECEKILLTLTTER